MGECSQEIPRTGLVLEINNGKMNSIWLAYCWDGLKPATRNSSRKLCFGTKSTHLACSPINEGILFFGGEGIVGNLASKVYMGKFLSLNLQYLLKLWYIGMGKNWVPQYLVCYIKISLHVWSPRSLVLTYTHIYIYIYWYTKIPWLPKLLYCLIGTSPKNPLSRGETSGVGAELHKNFFPTWDEWHRMYLNP